MTIYNSFVTIYIINSILVACCEQRGPSHHLLYGYFGGLAGGLGLAPRSLARTTALAWTAIGAIGVTARGGGGGGWNGTGGDGMPMAGAPGGAAPPAAGTGASLGNATLTTVPGTWHSVPAYPRAACHWCCNTNWHNANALSF